jgi:hypothetical protein
MAERVALPKICCRSAYDAGAFVRVRLPSRPGRYRRPERDGVESHLDGPASVSFGCRRLPTFACVLNITIGGNVRVGNGPGFLTGGRCPRAAISDEPHR